MDLIQDQMLAHKTISAHSLLLMAVDSTQFIVKDSMLPLEPVTVTGTTLPTEPSVSKLALKSVETVMDVPNLLTVKDSVAESVSAVLIQDQMLAQRTTSAHWPQLMVEPSTISNIATLM